MVKLVPLTSISSLRAGVQFRGEAPYSASGSIHLLQVRDAKSSSSIEDHELQSLSDDAVKPSDFLKLGDIVIRSKGKHHPAVLIEPELPQTVASGYCLIISPQKIHPAFLAWYLNQEPAQQYMDQHAIGTVIPVLNKKTLGEMSVPLPDLKTQERIAEIFTLQLQEGRIAKNLQQLYTLQNQSLNQSIINTVIINAVNINAVNINVMEN